MQNTGINPVIIVKSWKIYIVKIIQGTNWEPFFAPKRTKGEFLPCSLSSLIWWKWEQNKTNVVDNAGPEPSNNDSSQGISIRNASDGLSAIKAAEKAKGPKANQHNGSPKPW